MNNKIKINMLVQENMPEGQGVGSAYEEQVALLKEGSTDYFDIKINSLKEADITHHHTINPTHYFHMLTNKGVNVVSVHFLPHTIDGSIKLPKGMFNIFKNYIVNFYKVADYLVVVNPIFKNELERYKLKGEVVYIPNYVSKEDFYKKELKQKEEIRSKYNIDKNKFVVLGVGQVQTRKGVLDFCEVAKKLPDVEFVWCGGFSFGLITDGYNELKKVMQEPPKNVKFLGIIPRSEMNDMYNMADLLFMPSYNELFPMAILESANTNIPILLRDLDLYKEILLGKYALGNNNEEFVSEITKLSQDKKYYEKYSLLSKEISEFYSKENVLNMWIEFYSRIKDKPKVKKTREKKVTTKSKNTKKKK